MRKYVIAVINSCIILIMMVIVVSYSQRTSLERKENQIREFEDVTINMVQRTANYLNGAQQVVNSWGHYIDASDFTIEEAVDFLRLSQGNDKRLKGQILFVDQDENTGLSTDADVQDPTNYEVKYIKDTLFSNDDEGLMEHFPHEIRMTRMFTNQVDGMQSVAFYHPVVLRDSEDGKERRAVVMYVIPVSEFDDNFQINNSSLKSVESVIVTINGDYISKNGQFKNSNVLNFSILIIITVSSSSKP